MEPADNSGYSEQEYWDSRYTEEEQYDWFPSVYAECVAAVFSSVEAVYARQKEARDGKAPAPLTVLHLGTGNSALCEDVYRRYRDAYPAPDAAPYRLVQIAMDYSEVVIEKMKTRYTTEPSEATQERMYLPDVHWEVADIRDLSRLRREYGPLFDVIVDKGTMDALQADKANERMEEDIDRMLLEVSRCLRDDEAAANDLSGAAPLYRRFVQITWEIPYFRLAVTTKNDRHVFAWGRHARYEKLGDGDMYRIFIYDVPEENE